MRGTAAAAHGITSASGLVSYQEDFATDAAQDVGVHGAAAELIMQETFIGTAAEDVGILGSYAVKGIKDVQDGTRTAEEVLHTGGDVLRMELGSSAVQIGSAGARTALHYAESFSTSADDFTDRTPGIISNTGFQAGHSVIKVARFFAHPVKALASIGRMALICGSIVLLLLIIGLLGQMSGTTTTSVLCADRPEDIQQLIESINTYRNEAATDELRRAFRNDVDPNGNPYGYDTLTGQRSNNMQHGVTWSYANGIYNDTAEIISMAAVYYQQDWPSSQELAAFTDDVQFTQYCRALTAYGMEITAQESAPYSCISYGGCVNGYRSEGETVTITEYRCETHTCAQGNEECGHYRNGIWEWSDDHAEGSSRPEWIEDGTHDVTVFFPVIFPDGATQSELCALPDNYTQVVDGKIAAEDCTGSIVLDESANLYKGEPNDWFYAPNERTAIFTVETTDGDETMTQDYTVTFTNATAIPWCPGELHDGQYGHYDLNCTISAADFDKQISTYQREEMKLRNEIAELRSKSKIYAATAHNLQACRTYKSVWLEYASKPLAQKDTFYNQNEAALQAYSRAASQLDKMGISLGTEPEKVRQLVAETESRIADLIAELEMVRKTNQAIQEDKEKVEQIQSG